ncbi:MAG: hypothetical protein ACK5NG_02560 [Chthoniobacterales bacterium]
MTYQIGLFQTGLAVGILLLALHAMALLRPEETISFLKKFPRNHFIGTILLAAAAIWAFLLLGSMDLGEFARFRSIMQIAAVAMAILAWRFVDEFLAVRALGILLLLAAELLLCAAFLEATPWRLLLVILAYAWIILGLFWVGMPYILRDQITWITASATRLRLASLGGLAWGILLLFASFIFYRQGS